jgi:hypothetical protein
VIQRCTDAVRVHWRWQDDDGLDECPQKEDIWERKMAWCVQRLVNEKKGKGRGHDAH